MRRVLAIGVGLALWCAACSGANTVTETGPDLQPSSRSDAQTSSDADIETQSGPNAQTSVGPEIEPLSEPQIRRLLTEFVDEQQQSVGVVVGVTGPGGRVVVGHGRLSVDDATQPDGDTVEYSNVGFGLLGYALALREGTDFERLIGERILEPLHMSNTAVELAPALRERLAPGHDGRLRPVANWDLPTLAGAGALRSTVNDLLTFLEANLGQSESPLQQAMEFARAPQRHEPVLGMDIGLGWVIATEGGRQFVWHNGATGGYASFIGFDVELGEGIVILSNSDLSVDNLADRLFTRDLYG